MSTPANVETEPRRLKKNAGEDLLIRRTEFHGKDLLDVRVFAVNGPEPVPTKKGLCLQPDTWRELLPMIAEVLEVE